MLFLPVFPLAPPSAPTPNPAVVTCLQSNTQTMLLLPIKFRQFIIDSSLDILLSSLIFSKWFLIVFSWKFAACPVLLVVRLCGAINDTTWIHWGV